MAKVAVISSMGIFSSGSTRGGGASFFGVTFLNFVFIGQFVSNYILNKK